ncbi:preprotein translocase subunit SecE [Segnochrobactraceae bacterium EtOH-i3]
MAKTTPITFLREVRSEVGKVTWPTRRETGITTVLVFLLVFAASVFFLLVDWILGKGIGLLLGIGF